MAATKCLTLTVWLIAFSVGGAKQPSGGQPPSPNILSGDQSLPVSMMLPGGAMPTDLFGGMNQQGPVPSLPTAPGQPQMQPGMTSGKSYPVVMDQLSNVMPPVMPNMNIPTAPMSSTQRFQASPPGREQVSPSFGMSQPNSQSLMNMLPGQMMQSMHANFAMMNVQMACQSLQNFVLSTPMANQIMQSVSNMGAKNMADIFKSGSQCGFPALSTALRMFLKTCSLLTSCPNPSVIPFPMMFPPMPPMVPYMVQPQRSQQQPPGQPIKSNVPYVTRVPSPSVSASKSRSNQPTPPPQMMAMFQNFMYGPNNRSGQTARRNTTQTPKPVIDD